MSLRKRFVEKEKNVIDDTKMQRTNFTANY